MTIRKINNLLKQHPFYLYLRPYWEKAKIKKVEFDSENKRFWNWVNNIWAFYLIYDHNWVENIGEWIAYWAEKEEYMMKLYKTFEKFIKMWVDTIWV